ncbi:DNA ligase [Shewanella sp. KT0246]|uniref:DNA ligase n=1 Tax=Shewanella sp. KT0246 TaxID=2815912 RepID=UPI001BC72ABC|nr:DNA ligase [Shewanella sp. KT0246]GIU53087.1 ATP-dependent DNA ligase [Shewanella sp. KT0246]
MPRYLLSIIFLFIYLLIPICGFATDTVPIQLASRFHKSINVNDYYVSEKLDGVRGYWNGEKMLSRSGRVIVIPEWFTADFPKEKIDGELWIKRNDFEVVSALSRSHKAESPLWQQVTFMIFDLPEHGGAFSERVAKMKHIAVNSRYIQQIPQQEFTTQVQLYNELDRVIENQGEGLMLHKKTALYTIGRSPNIVKLKPKYDAEAVVVAHNEGKGKYSGLLGSITVEMPDGKRFNIGSGFSDQERADPPAVGAVVTYQYLGFTKNGIPRFAHFLRLRLEESGQINLEQNN